MRRQSQTSRLMVRVAFPLRDVVCYRQGVEEHQNELLFLNSKGRERDDDGVPSVV